MKIPKSYIGKMVEVWWDDPGLIRTVRIEVPLKGRAALAVQRERGVIDDITDGVVRVCHTLTTPPLESESTGTNHSYILEDLISKVIVYEEVKVPERKEGEAT